MNSKCFYKVSIIMLLLIIPIQYNSAQDLTIKQAIKEALATNFDIQMSDNTVVIAKSNAGVLNSGYLPKISANGAANYQIETSSISFADATTPTQDISDAETTQYVGAVNLNYTLFDGLGRYYTFKSLKRQYHLSKLEARATIENTILQLSSVYYEIARLAENKMVLDSTLVISKERVRRAEYGFEYGQNSKLRVLNAQVDVTNDSINVLQITQELQNRKRDLNVILNKELEQKFDVDTTITFEPKETLYEYIKSALTNNVVLLQQEKNIEIDTYTFRMQKAGYLPTIGLTGSYGWNHIRNPSGAFFPQNTVEGNAFNAGIQLSWNLFDGTIITKVKTAKLELNTRKLEKKQLEQRIRKEVRNAWDTYINRLKIFDIQEQGVYTNENNFKRSKEQWQLGQITSIEFRQAQINLMNAKMAKNLSKYNAKIAELELLQLAGKLLEQKF